MNILHILYFLPYVQTCFLLAFIVEHVCFFEKCGGDYDQIGQK